MDSVSSNKLLIEIIALFLMVYASLAGPKLPDVVRRIFDNEIFRVIFLTLIVYKGNKDPKLSIILAVSFTLIMYYIKKIELKEKFDMYFESTIEEKLEWIYITQQLEENNEKNKDYKNIIKVLIVLSSLLLVGGGLYYLNKSGLPQNILDEFSEIN